MQHLNLSGAYLAVALLLSQATAQCTGTKCVTIVRTVLPTPFPQCTGQACPYAICAEPITVTATQPCGCPKTVATLYEPYTGCCKPGCTTVTSVVPEGPCMTPL